MSNDDWLNLFGNAIRPRGCIIYIHAQLNRAWNLSCLSIQFLALAGHIHIREFYFTFTKPNCDNVLQPEPQSDEGCNTLSHSGLVSFKDVKEHLAFAKLII